MMLVGNTPYDSSQWILPDENSLQAPSLEYIRRMASPEGSQAIQLPLKHTGSTSSTMAFV